MDHDFLLAIRAFKSFKKGVESFQISLLPFPTTLIDLGGGGKRLKKSCLPCI